MIGSSWRSEPAGVLSEDGSKAVIDFENVKATQAMADAIKNGAAPKAVTTYMEPQLDQAFQTGKYTFLRNWTYAYALNQKAPKVKRSRSRRCRRSRARPPQHPRRPQQRHLRLLGEPGGA